MSTVEDYRPNPRRPLKHRADCTDFYCELEQNDSIEFRGPVAVIHAIEETSERAGRTFNAQLLYALQLCRGEHHPFPDDERTEEEWRALLGQLQCCFEDDQGEKWYPFTVILGKPHPPHRTF